MLILSRREGESVILETSEGPISVAITNVDGNQIKMGLDAPESVKILREELRKHSRS